MEYPKRDLLSEVYYDRMSNREADKIVDSYIGEIENPLALLGIDLGNEWTAIAVCGITYKTVAKWRYKGWPNVCVYCNRTLDKDIYRWTAHISIEANGKRRRNVISHQERAHCTEVDFDEDNELLKHYER